MFFWLEGYPGEEKSMWARRLRDGEAFVVWSGACPGRGRGGENESARAREREKGRDRDRDRGRERPRDEERAQLHPLKPFQPRD
jgi:hypothetical protein